MGMQIFNEPCGEGRIIGGIAATSGGILCELCGTDYPSVEDGGEEVEWIEIEPFGQIAIPCCGAFLDKLYEELGEKFALQYLEDFKDNPGSSDFTMFLYCLTQVLPQALAKIQETQDQVKETAGLAEETAKKTEEQ